MKIRTKQIFAVIIMIIFYSPFIYYGAIKNPNGFDFGMATIFWYLFGLISFPVIYCVLGKEVFQRRTLWEEDGYTNFFIWLKCSKSFTAKVFRWSIIIAIIVFIVSLIPLFYKLMF